MPNRLVTSGSMLLVAMTRVEKELPLERRPGVRIGRNDCDSGGIRMAFTEVSGRCPVS